MGDENKDQNNNAVMNIKRSISCLAKVALGIRFSTEHINFYLSDTMKKIYMRIYKLIIICLSYKFLCTKNIRKQNIYVYIDIYLLTIVIARVRK